MWGTFDNWKGPSMTTDQPPVTIQLQVKCDTKSALIAEARRRGVKPAEFASAIVEAVAEHNLYLAVVGQ